MKKPRVHELASELGTTSDELLRLLWSRGFFAKSPSSTVESLAVQWLRFEFSSDSPTPPATRPVSRGSSSFVRRRPRQAPEINGSSYRTWSLAGRSPVQRSMRTVELYGSKRSELATLDLPSIHQGLLGSPYSLPTEQSEYLVSNFLPRVAALSIRARREAQRVALERTTTLRRITTSTEVYESNKIEGLGADLATTDSILQENQLHRRADVSLAQQAIDRCLNAEPKIREVVGLGAARLLAETFCAPPRRPLTETDIRQLHELILVGDPLRGRYKGYLNSILGSDHVPTAPSDTPAAMSELVDWLAATTLDPLWRAAVAHAWLTHIHPFHDGNGRIARLLSNLVLIREGMPPLIVRAAGDRGAYLDALGASDLGGDILPLARVFRRVLSRGVEDLANPNLPHLFEDQIAERKVSRHVRWNRMLNEFLSELAPQLLLHRLHLLYIGEISDGELLRIGSGRPDNAWIAKVNTANRSRDLLLHVAAPTTLNHGYLGTGAVTPSIFVSVRNDRPLDARKYFPVGDTTFTYEFTPLVDANKILVRRGQQRDALPIHEAASHAADHLARIYRQLIGRPS